MDLAQAYQRYSLSAHAIEQREAPGLGQVLAERTLAVVKEDKCPFGPSDLQVSCHTILGSHSSYCTCCRLCSTCEAWCAMCASPITTH